VQLLEAACPEIVVTLSILISMIGAVLFIIFAVAVAVFFQCDADLPLVFLPYTPEKSFEGQVVWITGASSGIGASLAQDMVKAGAKVIISARRVAQLEAVADECASYGEKPFILPLDVTDYDAQVEAFNTIIEKFGHIDSLVLNAGMSQRIPAMMTDLEVTESLMKLNFMSFVSLAKIVVPSMLERKQGQLVIMSSISGVIGTPLGSSYSASKFALHGYFDALRSEYAHQGIGVTIVCPGPVVSEIADKSHRHSSLPKGAESEDKMPTARCTLLVAKAMYYKFSEVWITKQPILAFTYISQYMPGFANILATKLFGPARIRALESGKDVYDLTSMVADATRK